MASLDGHSLNVKIDRIHKETQEELAKMKVMFSELYGYIAKMESVKTSKKEVSGGVQDSKKKSKAKSKAIKKEKVLN